MKSIKCQRRRRELLGEVGSELGEVESELLSEVESELLGEVESDLLGEVESELLGG